MADKKISIKPKKKETVTTTRNIGGSPVEDSPAMEPNISSQPPEVAPGQSSIPDIKSPEPGNTTVPVSAPVPSPSKQQELISVTFKVDRKPPPRVNKFDFTKVFRISGVRRGQSFKVPVGVANFLLESGSVYFTRD